jgi:DNA-binding NarL/FixJ family response regulator
MRINILIVDDEALLRDGLKVLLKRETFVKEIYEAWDLKTFSEQVSSKEIHLVLLDIRLSGASGLDLLSSIKNKPDSPKIIVVTGLEGIELMINLLKLGVDGIVFKLDGYQEILKGIQAILGNKSYYPEKILKIIQNNAHQWSDIPPVTLTFQEKELLKCIASGLTTKEMAVQLKMAESTAETYRIRLIKKVGLPNTAALLAFSYRNGIL